MEIKKAEMIATDLIRFYAPEFRFKWDKGVKRFGLCSYTKKTISISKALTELNIEDQVLDTILHEIAHAQCGFEAGHNETWQIRAKSLGCDGKRLYDSNVVVGVNRPFTGKCPGCGKVIKRFRRKRLSCSNCGKGKFNPDFLFVWTKQHELESVTKG